jgi:hypothetical protein
MSYIRLRDTSAEATIREDLLRIGTVNRANPQRRSSRVKKMLDLTALWPLWPKKSLLTDL